LPYFLPGSVGLIVPALFAMARSPGASVVAAATLVLALTSVVSAGGEDSSGVEKLSLSNFDERVGRIIDGEGKVLFVRFFCNG